MKRHSRFYYFMNRMRPFGWGLIAATLYMMVTGIMSPEETAGLGPIPAYIGVFIALWQDIEE